MARAARCRAVVTLALAVSEVAPSVRLMAYRRKHVEYGLLMRRIEQAKVEHLGSGRRRKEDLRLIAARVAIGLGIATSSILSLVTRHGLSPFVAMLGSFIGSLVAADAVTRVQGRTLSTRVQRGLGLAQRLILGVLVVAAVVADLVSAALLVGAFAQASSGVGGSLGLAAATGALLAIGLVFLSGSAEPAIASVDNRRWAEQVGDVGSFVLASAVLIGLTGLTWYVSDGAGALTVACAVGLAQIGWLIAGRVQRARTVVDLATATRALTIAAADTSEQPTEDGVRLDAVLEPLLDLEVIVQRRDWRLPVSHRSRQLFDSEVQAMIEALVMLALPAPYTVQPGTLSRRLRGELQAMSYSERMVETAIFGADLRHLCTRARRWVRERPSVSTSSVPALVGANDPVRRERGVPA